MFSDMRELREGERRLGRYQLLREIGRGGMGVVYEALDTSSGMRVALKTLRHISADALYYLKREYRALQEIDHPNLIQLGELAEENSTWFFTMELLDGVELMEFLGVPRSHSAHAMYTTEQLGSDEDLISGVSVAACGLPPPPHGDASAHFDRDPDLVRWAFRELALGLCAVHGAGKVHRDVKPSNVLVTRDRRLVLLDFGLAVDEDVATNTDNIIRGTVVYMAPEQARGIKVGPAADWYSVGVALFEALTGRLPISGSGLQLLLAKQSTPPLRPSRICGGCPEDLDQLCLDLLHIEPEARPSGREILNRLDGGKQQPQRRASKSDVVPRAPLVGRSQEIEQLWAAQAQVAAGKPQIVLVCGESGIGKTTIIQHFAQQLAQRDSRAVILRGRCYEGESVPYKALDGVMDSLSHYLLGLPDQEVDALLPRKASLLVRAFPVLARVPRLARAGSAPSGSGDPLQLRERTFAALRELFGRIAERVPLVLIVDDLQWTDVDSVSVLETVLRGSDAANLLFLASLRSGITADKAERWLASAQLPNVTRVPVAPLAQDAATALAIELLESAGLDNASAGSRAAHAEKIAEGASGHPLFIAELVRYIHEGGRVSGVPLMQEAILYRVRQVPERARLLLELIALSASPLSRSVLRLAASSERESFDADWRLLSRAHLMRSESTEEGGVGEPYHDRVREAITDSLDEQRLRELHTRIVHGLEAANDAAPPELLATHLEGAGRLSEASLQAELAARRATDALAFDRAVDLFRHAERLGTDSAERATALSLALCDALIRAGRGMEAARGLLDVAATSPGALAVQCRVRAAEQQMVSGELEPGLRDLRQLLTENAIAYPKSQRSALLYVLWQRLRLKLERLRPRRAVQEDPRLLTALALYNAAVRGLLLVDPLRAACFATRGLLLALRARDPFYIVQFTLHEAAFHGSEGGRGLSYYRKRQREAADLAERSGDPILRGMSAVHDGVASYFEERFEHGLEKLAQGEAILKTATGTAWEISTPRFFQLECARRTGQLDWVAQRTQEYVRDAERRSDRYTCTTVQRLGAIGLLASDQPEAAAAQLSQARWYPPTEGYHVQHWYELRASIEHSLYTGQRVDPRWASEQFSALDRSLLPRVQPCRIESDWLRGRLALAVLAEQPGSRSAAAEVALRARRLSREGTGTGRFFALVLRANLALSKQETLAFDLLEQARELGRRQGLSLWASVVALQRAVRLEQAREAKVEFAQQAGLGVKAPHKFLRLLFATAN